ncbi:MAG TPA: hypothetical protein VGC05_20205, partial [Mycobacterium sp.]
PVRRYPQTPGGRGRDDELVRGAAYHADSSPIDKAHSNPQLLPWPYQATLTRAVMRLNPYFY